MTVGNAPANRESESEAFRSLTAGLAVEHLAAFSVPVSVFITIMGGVYFLYLILRSKGL